MSRKHYIKFAAMIREQISKADDGPERAGVKATAYAMMDIFAADNLHFDRDRFCIAAGIPRS